MWNYQGHKVYAWSISYENEKQDSLPLKMNDELLEELINDDVLHFDENTLAEKLLFIDYFAVEYIYDNSTILSVKEEDRMKRQNHRQHEHFPWRQ